MKRTSRLYWRIWLAVLASLLLFALLAGAVWKLFGERGINTQQRVFAELSAAVLPPPEAPVIEVAAALQLWRGKLGSDLALYGPDAVLIAATAPDMPVPSLRRPADDWLMSPRGPAFSMQLPDGRFLLARRLQGGPPHVPVGLALTLVLLAVAVGAGAYPVVRRLTRRLEQLHSGVERLGQGDLTARVAVRGCDEVALLAASFNRAAERIEQLVAAQKSLLANASHELRSPLARVRMAVEMLDHTPPSAQAALRTELQRNIGELDQLIDEILLASRLEAVDAGPDFEEIDLTALAAEECARVDAQLAATAVNVRGDPRLLRRLLRNLLENARRYGNGSAVDVSVRTQDGLAQITVCDRGPGVAAADRERVFEPFYRVPGVAESAGGVGLGLSLVRRIADQHRGRVVCEPRDGGGSCFRVTLPSG